jgi:hypothetical protein
MRALLFTLMSVVTLTAFAATVYRWVDDNGVVHYSDQPHENAEKVHVAAPQTYKALPAPAVHPGAPTPRASNAYQCQVTAPANDATFPNTSSVATAVQVNPPPRNGDQVALLLDGAQVANFPSTGGSFTIDPIDRGQHTLQAVVRDVNGKVVCQSTSVTFTILQPSVLNPSNPNFKR